MFEMEDTSTVRYLTVHGAVSTVYDFIHVTNFQVLPKALMVIRDRKCLDREIPILYISHSRWIDFERGVVHYPKARKNFDFLITDLLFVIEEKDRNTPLENVTWHEAHLKVLYAQFGMCKIFFSIMQIFSLLPFFFITRIYTKVVSV